MGVRTRPGIKHDHGHNQQREALAEQHRDGTGAVLHRGQRTVLGLRQRHCPLPWDGRGTGWPLSLDGCWALASARDCCFLQDAGFWDPSGSPSPGALGLGSVCPWCGGRAGLWCSAPWEHPKLWLFLFFFFLLFWQQTYPSRCSGESKTVHRGLLPCQPLRTGVRAEVLLWGRDCAQEPT